MDKLTKNNYYIITLENAGSLCCTFPKTYIATKEMLQQLLTKLKTDMESHSLEDELLITVEKFLNGEKNVKYLYWDFATEAGEVYESPVTTLENYIFTSINDFMFGIDEITLKFVFVPCKDGYDRFVIIDEFKCAYEDFLLDYTLDRFYLNSPNIFLINDSNPHVIKPLLGFYEGTISKEEFEKTKDDLVSPDISLGALIADLASWTL